MNFQQILMAAATQGGGAAAETLGPEKIVNGDCSSGTGWTFSAGGSITGGKMQLAAYSDVVDNSGIFEEGLIEGATYRCVLTIDTATLGSIFWDMGGAQGTSRSTAGTFSQDIVAGAGGGGNLNASEATMQLDNFSVKQVNP